MAKLVARNQTAQPLLILLVLASDHVSPATGKTPTVTISKNGGAFGAPAGAVSEVGNGWYAVAGNATDANTLGPLVIHATEASSDPADERYEVVAFDPQDAAALGLTRISGDAFARLGAPAGASVSADVAAVAAKTTNLPASPAAVGSAMTLAAQERNDTADAILKRDWTLISGAPPARSAWNALRLLRNAWSVVSGLLKVAKEDDDLASPAWTAVTTADGSAAPITGSDPT